MEGVDDADVAAISAQGDVKAESLLRVIGARVLTPTAVFPRVEGAASSNVTIDGGDLSKAATVRVP